MLYDLMEFATAVKPSLLKTLLARGAESVTYFDPDIEIFAPARRHRRARAGALDRPDASYALAAPARPTRAGRGTLLLAGMFNLGFISVSREARTVPRLVGKSASREPDPSIPVTESSSISAGSTSCPSLFEHTVLRDPTVNVAHWNLESRRLTSRIRRRYLVDGQPLRFFHFSGFDPDKAYLLSKFLGPEPRILLSESPCAVADSARPTRRSCLRRGIGRLRPRRMASELCATGFRSQRRCAGSTERRSTRRREQGGAEPPNPFAKTGSRPFMEWLNEPVHPRRPTLTRYLADAPCWSARISKSSSLIPAGQMRSRSWNGRGRVFVQTKGYQRSSCLTLTL